MLMSTRALASFPLAGLTMSGAPVPSERAGPWYLMKEQVENSPSQQYFARKYGSVERARIREQEARQTTCAFLQESGQRLRLCAAPHCASARHAARLAHTARYPAAPHARASALSAWPCRAEPASRPQLSIATAIVFYHRFYARETQEGQSNT